MRSWRFYCDYLMHWWRAKTRHGTHSPFVYRLLEEVIYAPRLPDESRDNVERLAQRLKTRFAVIVVESDDPEQAPGELTWHRGRVQENTVLFVTGIYRNCKTKQLWQTIKDWPEVSITVDLFHTGLVFFHSGQAREHFRIW